MGAGRQQEGGWVGLGSNTGEFMGEELCNWPEGKLVYRSWELNDWCPVCSRRVLFTEDGKLAGFVC